MKYYLGHSPKKCGWLRGFPIFVCLKASSQQEQQCGCIGQPISQMTVIIRVLDQAT